MKSIVGICFRNQKYEYDQLWLPTSFSKKLLDIKNEQLQILYVEPSYTELPEEADKSALMILYTVFVFYSTSLFVFVFFIQDSSL